MSASTAVIQRMEQRAQLADDMIAKLKSQLDNLKSTAAAQQEQKLKVENEQLREQVALLKSQLAFLESRNGLAQIPVADSTPSPQVPKSQVQAKPEPKKSEEVTSTENDKPQQKGGKKEGKPKEKKAKGGGGGGGGQKAPPAPVDVSLVDFRVGVIKEVKLHPDADTLYVEQVDCGEAEPRTVVSGLVNNIPIEEMENRVVILCCNLKPVKMRGILSQAMVMCACKPDKVEILSPPAGAVPGDRITVEGYPLPAEFPPQMNPKKKIFEQVKPDLTTNAEGVATYKGAVWKIEGKGVVTAQSLVNTEIH